MNIEQEPKYDVNADGKIINRATGIPIPDDEPVFILRAKDNFAIDTLIAYFSILCAVTDDHEHLTAVRKRIDQFKQFANDHPERMQNPDTKPAGAGG